MKIKILFFAIFFLTFFLRIYKIVEIPSGFYSDESLVGYEAYSILKTGRDQYGNFLPILFKAFGDYRPGLFIYSTVPFIGFFGLNQFATRLPSVIFSSFSVIFIFLLTLELFNNKKVALFSSLMFAISPWSIQFARMSHDVNLSTLLVLIVLYCILKFIRDGKYIFLLIALVTSSFSFYVYYTSRIFLPLLWIYLVINYWKQLFLIRKQILLWLIICLFILIPFIQTSFNSETGWARVNAVSLWGDPGIKGRIIENRSEDEIENIKYSSLFHNKYIDGSQGFIKSFLSHFDPYFLLLRGELNEIYTTPGNGLLMYSEALLILVGIYFLLKKDFLYNKLFSYWLIIGLLPDTLTRLAPAAPRIHVLLPLSVIISGYGLWSVFSYIKFKKVFSIFFTSFIFFILIFNFIYFLHNYLVHLNIRYANQWHYGLDQLIKEVSVRENEYDKIWISRNSWGWINFLFFLKYPPELAQNEIKLSEKNEFGLGWVYDIGKYHFDDFPSKIDFSKKILYVGSSDDFPKNIDYEMVIYYPNKNPAFYIVNNIQFENAFKKLNK